MSDNRMLTMLKEFVASSEPKNVNAQSTIYTSYWESWLLERVYNMLVFDLPDTWDKDYFITTLFNDGYIAVTDTELGVIPLSCGLSGQNVFLKPTTANFANPVLGSFDRAIVSKLKNNGSYTKLLTTKPCVIVKIYSNYRSIRPVINRYASMLAMCDRTINVNLLNSSVAFIGETPTQQQANTLKAMFSKIAEGEPAVFIKKTEETNWFYTNPKQSFIADVIQTLKTSIINEFYNEIGINNANTLKKERLNQDEVNSNNDAISINIDSILGNIRTAFSDCNILYPMLHISVNKRYKVSDNTSENDKEGDAETTTEEEDATK